MSKLEEIRHISLEIITREERSMADFSECLTEIKNRRNLTAAQMAGICEMDRAVIFRWCNGSALPESWEQLSPLIRRLRLTGEEKKQLKAAFEKEWVGIEQSSCFAEIKSIFRMLKQYAERKTSSNRELYRNMYMDYDMPEFLVLHNKADLLRCVRKALSELIEKKNRLLYINVKTIPENLLILLEQFCRGVDYDGMEIVVGVADYSYRSELEKLQLLHVLLELQCSNIKIIWSCRKDIVIQDGQSRILADSYCFQFPDDMEYGIMTGSREWLSFFGQMSKGMHQSGKLLLESCYTAGAHGQGLADYIMEHQPQGDDRADICVKLFSGQESNLEISFYPCTKEERRIIVTDDEIVNCFHSFLEYIAEPDCAYAAEEENWFVKRMPERDEMF